MGTMRVAGAFDGVIGIPGSVAREQPDTPVQERPVASLIPFPVDGATVDSSSGYRRRLLRKRAFDGAALAAAGAIAVGTGTTGAFLPLAAAPCVIFGLRLGNLYRALGPSSALDQLTSIVLASTGGALVGAAAAGATAASGLALAVLATLTLLLGRATLQQVIRRQVVARPRRVVVVGTGTAGQAFADRLLRHPEHGMVPLGFVDSRPEPLDPDLAIGVVGSLPQLDGVLRRLKVDRVIIDAASVREDDLVDLLDTASRSRVEIAVLPVLAQHLSTAITVEDLAGMTLLAYRPSAHRGVSWALKRVVDVTVAATALLLTAPVFLLAALAVRLDSPGPVLFRQQRVGRNGRVFTLYKLRSMRTDAEAALRTLRQRNEADGPYFKMAADPRVTRVGRWLRRYSIDELPQLLNVLKGDMSVVGPRPALPEEVSQYPEWFRRRLTVPPGLTGLWQVSGRFLLSFHEACRLDVFYVDHWSMGLDLKILLRTPSVVLSGRGAR